MPIYHQKERTWVNGLPLVASAGEPACLSSAIPATLLGLDCNRTPSSSTSGDVGLLRDARDVGLDGGTFVAGLSPVFVGFMYDIIVVEDPRLRFSVTGGLWLVISFLADAGRGTLSGVAA